MPVCFSHRLKLNVPKKRRPKALARLAETMGFSQHTIDYSKFGASCDFYPPREPEQLLELITEGHGDAMSMLEWIHLIGSKADWDRQNPQKASAASNLIWNSAFANRRLLRILFIRLAHHFSAPDRSSLADSIITSYRNHFRKNWNRDDLAISILDGYVRGAGPQTLAKESHSLLKQPADTLKIAGLPSLPSLVDPSLDCVVDHFLSNQRSSAQVEWLIECLCLMNSDQQIKAVDALLAGIHATDGQTYPKLLQWVREHYNPRIPGSNWKRLSDKGKAILQDWFGLVNYAEFEQIVDHILSLVGRYIDLGYYDINRLKRRKIFWRQYSTHFSRIRVLLPRESLSLLQNFLKLEINGDIDELLDDGSENTEICIFDFERCLITEFFRGNGSEIRIFPQKRIYSDILFGTEKLSIKLIRSMGGKAMDHVFLWQNEVERVLRQDWNITPNKEVTRFFKTDEDAELPYDRNKGIIAPSPQKASERETKYQRWRKQITDIEHDAIQYCRFHPRFSEILMPIGILG